MATGWDKYMGTKASDLVAPSGSCLNVWPQLFKHAGCYVGDGEFWPKTVGWIVVDKLSSQIDIKQTPGCGHLFSPPTGSILIWSGLITSWADPTRAGMKPLSAADFLKQQSLRHKVNILQLYNSNSTFNISTEYFKLWTLNYLCEYISMHTYGACNYLSLALL